MQELATKDKRITSRLANESRRRITAPEGGRAQTRRSAQPNAAARRLPPPPLAQSPLLRGTDYNLADIRAYLQVVESRSISRAADRLGLSKSVVSERVAHLESTLRSKLLHRSTRGIVPTDKGQLFYNRMCDLIGQLTAAVDEIADDRGELCGRIRMTMPVTFGTDYIAPLLFGFLKDHPAVALALDLDDRFLDLQGGGFDLGIRIGRLQDSDLVARGLAPSRRVVCAGADYARRNGLPRSVEELRQHECIGSTTNDRLWQFAPGRPGGDLRTPRIVNRIRVNTSLGMREAAMAGLGLAVLPLCTTAPALRDGTLVAASQLTPTAETVYAVYPRTRYLGKVVRLLIDSIAAAFQDGPPWERGLPAAGVAPAPVRKERRPGRRS